MKTFTFLFLLLMTAVNVHAQYQISFSGSGAGTNVDSVKVENLSQCTKIIFSGKDILNLTSGSSISEQTMPVGKSLNVSPNPMNTNCQIDFEVSVKSNTMIGLYDINGKSILYKQELLAKGHHTYNLSGISSGIYTLKITSSGFSYTSKIVCNNQQPGTVDIKRIISNSANDKSNNLPEILKLSGTEEVTTLVNMPFKTGDTLKITGISANYRTVYMLFPAGSQTITFNFIDCTDADNNHYAVVKIGTQIWMGENLKTTKYRDATAIPNVTDSAIWGNLNTGAYCDFHNLPAEGSVYGHLYNFYAVADNRKLCPSGWHVPSNSEWNVLEKFLDPTDDTITFGGRGSKIGRILKENCNTRWQYMDTTWGTNAVGFSALCANFRNATGAWSKAPNDNHDDGFWTSTSYNTNSAWYRSFRWCFGDIYALFPFKKSGNSVRCIKD